MLPDQSEILKVVSFKTSRSGGKGGQNVNKVSSKVELIFNIDDALFFSDDEKARLKEKLALFISTAAPCTEQLPYIFYVTTLIWKTMMRL